MRHEDHKPTQFAVVAGLFDKRLLSVYTIGAFYLAREGYSSHARLGPP